VLVGVPVAIGIRVGVDEGGVAVDLVLIDVNAVVLIGVLNAVLRVGLGAVLVDVVRPADANETAAAWAQILRRHHAPAGLVLSRQNLPVLASADAAAEKIAGVVAGKFQDIPGAAREAVAETAKAMEGFKRTQVEDKARASNARKIQRAIENHDKALKRYEEREAKRRGEHAEKNAKRKKPTEYKAGEAPKFQMPELDKPDYDSIKRSFQEYWIDGLKEMMNQNLNNTIINGGFLDQFKSMGVGAVQALRSQFGGHPLLDQIEAGLNDPNFSGRVKKALEEAKIGEIPVTFALENLSQLKSDLGMGNGAISRAINQAVKFEPTNSDFDQERRAREREEKEPSIHYHVLSVEEVLRLEEVRHRKIQMRDHDD